MTSQPDEMPFERLIRVGFSVEPLQTKGPDLVRSFMRRSQPNDRKGSNPVVQRVGVVLDQQRRIAPLVVGIHGGQAAVAACYFRIYLFGDLTGSTFRRRIACNMLKYQRKNGGCAQD